MRGGHRKDFCFLITQIQLVLHAYLPFLIRGKTGYEPQQVPPQNHSHISHADKALTESGQLKYSWTINMLSYSGSPRKILVPTCDYQGCN